MNNRGYSDYGIFPVLFMRIGIIKGVDDIKYIKYNKISVRIKLLGASICLSSRMEAVKCKKLVGYNGLSE